MIAQDIDLGNGIRRSCGKIEGLFCKAARVKGRKFRTEKEWETFLEENGTKNFKRKALGLCGVERIVYAKELCDLLVSSNIAKDDKEAREYLPVLSEGYSSYGGLVEKFYICFQEVTNRDGEIAYRISTDMSKMK